MAHTHSVIDDDLHFIIDPSTREIGNGSQKVKLMQYDHNSEQFTFEIPRFVEGHDMSLCNSIRVNYININKSTREQHPGVYEVSDIQVEEDNIIFSWLVSRNATQYVGPLNFLIKFMCFDENDYITYEWHTDIFKSASVSTGMNNEESIEEVYPDILEKWKSDVLAEEASRITAESERVTAESKRATAESERVAAESKRVTAESERATAESERVTAESERVAAESERVAAESKRVTAESERVAAESERVTAESERVTAESERVTAESERAAAESERVTAESERVTAESERANTFAGYETEINQFKNEIVTGKDSATDNTKFAIGEAEPNLEVPTMEEFNQLAEDMTGKLSEPAEGLAMGKYFRVAALDENGHAVLEAVDAAQLGVQDVTVNGVSIVKDSVADIMANGHGIGFNNVGLYLASATNNQVAARLNSNVPLTPTNYDYAVKLAMCDGKGAAWTADEQAAARERMGIDKPFSLIEEFTLEEDTTSIVRNIEPDGTPYNYKHFICIAMLPNGNTDRNIGFRYNINGNLYSTYYLDIKSQYALYYAFEANVRSGRLFCRCALARTAASGGSNISNQPKSVCELGYYSAEVITSISLEEANGIGYPAGTNICLYGVRA